MRDLSKAAGDWRIRLALGFALIGFFAASGQWLTWRHQRLSEVAEARSLSEQLLRRAELSADYAVIAVGDLVLEPFSTCSKEEKAELQRFTAVKGAVKDIAIIDAAGDVSCSGSDEAADLAEPFFLNGRSFATRNAQMSLKPGPDPGTGMFALLWQIAPERAFLIILNIDTLMFDVFPPEWRDSADAEIAIGSDVTVARFEPDDAVAGPSQLFVARSDRYPLEARLRIATSVLSSWRSFPATLGGAIGGAFGLMVWALLLALAARWYGPAFALRKANIKIDKKFVDLVGDDVAATAIVVLLVGLARRLGMTTIAEGIEREAQLTELLRCGVDEGRGYLISPRFRSLILTR